MRLPPSAVSRSTIPSGSASTTPISTAPEPSGWPRRIDERLVCCLGRDHGDELALVRHVERIDAEDLASREHGRPHRERALL